MRGRTPGSAGSARQRILIIRQGAFGDLIQADGALRDIRSRHADAHIELLVSPAHAKLMARCPHLDGLILDPRASWLAIGRNLRLLRQLRAQGYERIYDLQGSQRTRLYRRALRDSTWFRKYNPSDSDRSDREVYADLLARAGVPLLNTLKPDVAWAADDVTRLLADAGIRPGYVALVPGSAAQHPHKRWPHYDELAQRLQSMGRQVVVAPGPDELEMARSLPCTVLTGTSGYLDWFALAGVLRGAAFVIGNDTGPTHLAACLGTPGLALFGPHTRVVRTGIRLRDFDALQVPDLAALRTDDVLARIAPQLA